MSHLLSKRRKEHKGTALSCSKMLTTQQNRSLVSGAINSEEPLSLQHWLDSLGVATTVFGAYQMGKSAMTNVPHGVTGNADDAAGVVTQETKDVIDDIAIRKDNIRLSLNANKSLKPQELLDELAKSNVKYNIIPRK